MSNSLTMRSGFYYMHLKIVIIRVYYKGFSRYIVAHNFPEPNMSGENHQFLAIYLGKNEVHIRIFCWENIFFLKFFPQMFS